ncbi:MAG: HAMP domain-containing histidine kinase [Flavobacteriales bacterium]|nr:HAMP domain-containing histidine kinase [Flavobacteriales bacterium]
MKTKTLTNKLITKLSISFTLLILMMGAGYVLTSIYFTNKYYEETSQRLNASLADHLIAEKFKTESPFLEDGSVNKALFGDLMHDMMAVNGSIEVYLLNNDGGVLYSVVLDHSRSDKPVTSVNLAPVKEFIANKGSTYILGDDPRDPGVRSTFSAAHFEVDNHEGYIYIILSGQELHSVQASLASSYFLKLGMGSLLLTVLFVTLIGLIAIWFLTKNLRGIVRVVRRFQEGDLEARIENPDNSDVAVLANTFNEMADTIVQNMDEIKGVDRLRRELIANVSHDLRTPLAILKGYIETLQIKKETLTEIEKEQYLQIVQDSSDRLAFLISQLFEYSKLEAKQVEPQKEAFAITDLAGDLISNYQVMAQKKNINLKFEAEKNIPLAFADIGLVERAIQNLMDNALKFTPEGGSISLKVEPSDKFISVTVSDTGPGIEEADQAAIFDRYEQAKQDHKRHGIGLGLAIVKKIMELHNTTITLVSKPNEGSSFQFLLPVNVG